MKKLTKLTAAMALGMGLSAPAVAQDAGPLSGLSTLNGLTPLIEAGADPALLPALGQNVAGGLLVILQNGAADPSGLTGLSPLDIASLPDILTGTVMIQNYPGGAALIPVVGAVAPVLGGVLGN